MNRRCKKQFDQMRLLMTTNARINFQMERRTRFGDIDQRELERDDNKEGGEEMERTMNESSEEEVERETEGSRNLRSVRELLPIR